MSLEKSILLEQSILNASVPDQLRAIANWHDDANPSRWVLGAVASCALNYINTLEAERNALLARVEALKP